MLNIYKYVLIALTIVILAGAATGEEWNRTFGGSGADYMYNVNQTADGGYVIVGETSGNAWLIKTDANGKEQWKKTLVEGKALHVRQDSDRGYSIVGQRERDTYLIGECVKSINGTVCWDMWPPYVIFWLIKTDAKGNKQWETNLTIKGKNDNIAVVAQTSDGGYILLTTTNSYGKGYFKYSWLSYLIKMSSNGTEQWNRTFGKDIFVDFFRQEIKGNETIYGAKKYDYANSVQETQDRGYILAGSNAMLFKISADGNEEWNATIEGRKDEQVSSIQQTEDGGYILTGRTPQNATYGDIFLIKTDDSGKKQWNRTFGGVKDESVADIEMTSDGGYLLAGRTSSYGSGNFDAWLIKTDENGDEQWNRTFGGNRTDQASSVYQTRDGGYIVSARTNSYGAGDYDAWLIKVENDENDAVSSQKSIAGFEILELIFSVVIILFVNRKNHNK